MLTDHIILIANISILGNDENHESWRTAIGLLSIKEKNRAMQFYHFDDKRRNVLSTLLQHSLIHCTFGYFNHQYVINRIPEGKPYLEQSSAPDPGYWNYNVSHHGSFVGIAAHSQKLIGIDIVDIKQRFGSLEKVTDVISTFNEQLHSLEIIDILRQPTASESYLRFFLIWSLKEAFIKAIGQGLGFDLKQLQFSVCYDRQEYSSSSGSSLDCDSRILGTATVSLQDERRPDWSFDFFSLDERHVMTVARGPLTEAIPSYQETAWKGKNPISILSARVTTNRPVASKSMFSVFRRGVENTIHSDSLDSMSTVTTTITTASSMTDLPTMSSLGQAEEDEEKAAAESGVGEGDSMREALRQLIQNTGCPVPLLPESLKVDFSSAFMIDLSTLQALVNLGNK